MATTRKSKAVRRPIAAGPKESPDAPSPAVVSGAPTPLRVVPPPVVPDPEVRERAARRRFTAEYKLQVLRQADQWAGVGELGALLRREGLYSSHLTSWRKKRDQSQRAALEPKKRGPKPSPKNPLQSEVAKLTRENAKLNKKLRRAELIIDLQKKVSQILGITLPVLEESDDDEVNS